MDNRPNEFEDIKSDSQEAGSDFSAVDINAYSAPRKKYDTAEISPKLSSIRYSDNSGATAGTINGISYRKLRKDRIMFNNSEPFSIAVKKILVQLFVILFVVCGIFAILVGKSFVMDKLSDDSYFSLSMSSSYSEALSLKVKDISFEESPGFACISAAAELLGENISEKELDSIMGNPYSARLADGMAETISKTLPGHSAVLKENQSNYDLLTDIYKNLKAGLPVLIKYYGENEKNEKVYTWGLVSALDFGKDSITVKNAYGVTQKLSTDLFIDATRARDISSLSLRTEFVLGIQNKNTVILFKD